MFGGCDMDIRAPCPQIIFLIQLNLRMLGLCVVSHPYCYEATDLFKHSTS